MEIKIYFIISILLLILALCFIAIIIRGKRLYKGIYISKDRDKINSKEEIQTTKSNQIQELNNTKTLNINKDVTQTNNRTLTLLQDEIQSHKTLNEGDVLNNKYRIEKVLGSGAQGSVYVCTNVELGNKWAAKHFDGSLNEKEILVKLNHICLPKISDLFQDEKGTYIIESYIEGKALDNVIKKHVYMTEDEVIEWLLQLSEALHYIHQKNILHMDIKPQNIIITEDNRAILIDFGIATHVNDTGNEKYKVYGYSPAFCPPEQKNNQDFVDERSDIYALAATAFFALTKTIPEDNSDMSQYREDISKDFANLIMTCLASDKEERYPNAKALSKALESIKKRKVEKEKTRIKNKILGRLLLPLCLIACILSYIGYEKIKAEKTSIIEVNVKHVVLNEQQTEDIFIKQIYKSGKEKDLTTDKITWEIDNEKVALVERGQIVGINQGSTKITGRFGNKLFTIDVEVKEGVLGVDIALRYNENYKTSIYAGNKERDLIDGSLTDASFLDPTSLTITGTNTMYVVDGWLRKIQDEQVTTVKTDYWQPAVVRSFGQDVYFATKEWLTEDNQYMLGICQLVNDQPELILNFPATMKEITDFTFDEEGNIYAIITDYIDEISDLVKIDFEAGNMELLIEGEEYLTGIAIDDNHNVYVSQGKNSIIYQLTDDNTLAFFAGAKYEKDFKDGQLCRFYQPTALTTDGTNLYVMDYNIVRKIIIEEGVIKDVETLSGSIEGKDESMVYEGESYEVTYDGDGKRDLVYERGKLYVADWDGHVIRIIK